jgi:hypothetical protein
MLSGPDTTELRADTATGVPPDDWTDQDRALVGQADRALADGQSLLRWWQRLDAVNGYGERFDLIRAYNESDHSFGFFDSAPYCGGVLPVMGVVEDLLYDQTKQTAPNRVRDEFREFVLHYFMRISAFEQPGAYADQGRIPPTTYREGLSWCPQDIGQRAGFGFSQLYFKRADTGELGKFPRHQEFACVDLREIGPRYAWTVCKVQIFDFNLTLQPGGAGSTSLVVPLREQNYLVVSPDFIANRDDPAPGVLGEYGFGYAVIPDPTDNSILAYGPGHFRAGFQLIHFRVMANGETWVRLVFVVNRPDRILNIPIDPIGWSFRLAGLMSLGLASRVAGPAKRFLDRSPFRLAGFDPISAYITLANALTGGAAAEDLCISRPQLEKDFLVQHFQKHYQMIVGSLLTWRHIPNWLDEQAIPDSIESGVGS